MTDQEKQLIAGLAEKIKNAPAPQIDRDAYDLILHTIGTRPDALYVLTQTVLIQQLALDQAKAQIDQLQRQPAPQQASFLPGGQPASVQDPPHYQGSGYGGSGYDAPAPPPPPQGSRFSNFLHNAATTAAGVIAGEVAFDALSSLFGGGRGGYYGGGNFLGGGGIVPGSETIINNYYDDDRDRGSRFSDAAAGQQGISPDIDDERDRSTDNFADDNSGNDSSDNFDDDSSYDSGDDSGGSDL
jgi:hypothetical protein